MSDTDVPRMPRRNKKIDDPKIIGLWKIGRTIGKGSSGRVRIARHSKTGQYAAVKIVSKTSFANSRMNLPNIDDQTERILLGIEREIVIMKLINHPNIMRLYDVWETSSDLYLILEYVEGGELFDYLCSKGKLSTSEGRVYFQQIIAAIDYCHRFNIAHRDLKPENLLLDADKNIKVADFGMAAWQANANNGMLQTACGSPHYAAPEVIMGQAYNGSLSDIWSCGVILYALLAGRLPFDDEDLQTLLEKVKIGKYTIPSDMDLDAKDLISRMLQKDLAKRITIPEILQHPFYTVELPKATSSTPAPSLQDAARGIGSIRDIDTDILANLRTLWQGIPEQQIIDSLKDNEQTLHKSVYHLLMDYRANHLEHYHESEEETIRRASKRRSKKNQQVGVRELYNTAPLRYDQDHNKSVVSIPPRCDPPTPNRASRVDDDHRNLGNDLGPPRIILSSSSVLDWENLRSPLPSNETPVSPISVDAVCDRLNLPPLDVPDMQDDKIQRFFHQIVEHLNKMEAVTLSENGTPIPGETPPQRFGHRNSAEAPMTPVDGILRMNGLSPSEDHSKTQNKQFKSSHGLGISNNSNIKSFTRSRRPPPLKLRKREDKENVGTVNTYRGAFFKRSILAAGDQATHSETRHVQILEPDEMRFTKADTDHDAHSPAFSDNSFMLHSPAVPRHTWFNTIFRVKPTSFQLLSIHDAHTTREECQRQLVGLGVGVVLTQAESMGVLKCRLDEVRDPAGVMAVIKAISFRVELLKASPAQAAAGYQVAMNLVQEKGALSSFRTLYVRLRREWDLDAPRTPGPTHFARSIESNFNVRGQVS